MYMRGAISSWHMCVLLRCSWGCERKTGSIYNFYAPLSWDRKRKNGSTNPWIGRFLTLASQAAPGSGSVPRRSILDIWGCDGCLACGAQANRATKHAHRMDNLFFLVLKKRKEKETTPISCASNILCPFSFRLGQEHNYTAKGNPNR
jgi:hypothetical protein